MESWHSISAGRPRTSTLVRGVTGCIAMTVVQCFRVSATRRLLAERKRQLGELLDVDSWQRQQLSEQLHDEALQYILAARMDLDDVRDQMPPDAMRRIDVALSRASGFLRATVGELRPVVLEQWDLRDAIRQLTQTVAPNSGLTIAVESAGWPSGTRTSADAVLFGVARELLSRVVTQAAAGPVSVSLKLVGEQASLHFHVDYVVVSKDELMSPFTTTGSRLSAHRVRIEAAGGRLEFASTPGNDTLITVLVPAVADSQVSTDGESANSDRRRTQDAREHWVRSWPRRHSRDQHPPLPTVASDHSSTRAK
jgi:two-component system, NarL family, sensor kinase